MLIKCVVVLLLAMLACLMGGDKLMLLLTWPLRQIQTSLPHDDRVAVFLGEKAIASLPGFPFGLAATPTNRGAALRLAPVRSGTNWLMALEFDAHPTQLPTANGPVLKNYGPLGGIMVALQVGIYGGLIIASPFLLYFIGRFAFPLLKVRDRRTLYQFVMVGSALFLMGVAFCYFFMMGVALTAGLQFSQWMGFAADEWRAEDFVSFICRFMLGMGFGFELPVIILTLVKCGLLDYLRLVKFRQYVIIVNLVIAGIITPPDPFTMFLMALPLQFLYEVSVVIAWYWHRQAHRSTAKAQSELSALQTADAQQPE